MILWDSNLKDLVAKHSGVDAIYLCQYTEISNVRSQSYQIREKGNNRVIIYPLGFFDPMGDTGDRGIFLPFCNDTSPDLLANPQDYFQDPKHPTAGEVAVCNVITGKDLAFMLTLKEYYIVDGKIV